jgi:hypothetical protein
MQSIARKGEGDVEKKILLYLWMGVCSSPPLVVLENVLGVSSSMAV